MSQQINLLNPALIPQKEYLNVPVMAGLVGLAALCMLGAYGLVLYQYRTLSEQGVQVAAQLAATQASMMEASKRYAPREPSKQLEEEIGRAETRLKGHENILAALGQGPAGRVSGFSPYLRAFAHQGMKGLWLTGFRIDAASKGMTISGRALEPGLVPQYIAQLGNEPTLKGKTFATLEMSRPEQTAVPAENAAPATPKPLPYVEFVLQSSNGKLNAQGPVTENRS